MAAATTMAKKRPADEEVEALVISPKAKQARFSKTIDYEALSRVDEECSPRKTSTPFSPRSVASTEQQSIAETSMTSRSTSKRPKKYICEYDGCGKAFDRPVRLQAHLRTHTDDRPFVCEEEGCGKSFFKVEHLRAHVQNKHSDTADFVCTYVLTTNKDGEELQCGKAFTTASRLKRHVAVHEEKEDLKCHEIGCGQVFRKMDTLQRHIKKEHLNENSYRCDKHIHGSLTGAEEECGQTFSTVGQLKSHEIKEHIGLKYFCEMCTPPSSSDNTYEPVGFHTYAEYQAHLKTAHPPTCTICFQICASKRALTAHMEIEHSVISSRQQFKCNYPDCGRKFTKKGNLNVHVQNVHIKNKKFVCGEFDLSESWKVPGWDASTTPSCGMSFGTKGNLEEHVRTQHLDLPSLYHPRKSKLKPNSKARMKQEATPTSTPSSIMDLDEPPEDPTTLALLTGHGYATTRPLACWKADDEGCPHRFTRPYDLALHMEIAHGWNIDDINERFAEAEALEGGRFWIGGKDAYALEEEDGDEEGEEEDGDGLRVEGLSLDEGLEGMFEDEDGMDGSAFGFGVYGDDLGLEKVVEGEYGPSLFEVDAEDGVVIDPMLVDM